jgi:lysozyme
VKASERCIEKLMQLEGYTPVAKHLPADRPGVITGGFGDTDVKPGESHTREEWEARLLKRMEVFEGYVNRGVSVPLTQEMFDSLVVFVYNVGGPAFLESTLRAKLNLRDYIGASHEFARWNKSDGKVQAGLVNRRAEEESWFLEQPIAA